VVLDLPPHHTPTLAAALMIANAILVPVMPSALGLPATRETWRMIEVARTSRRRAAPMALLVPNRIDPDDLEETAGAFPELVERRGPTLRERREHMAAFAAGDWIGAHAPASPAARDVLALVDALQEILKIERVAAFQAARAAHATT
jgi:cellulose biosynthesis protein BcsQ